jgi:hypothetical protein
MRTNFRAAAGRRARALAVIPAVAILSSFALGVPMSRCRRRLAPVRQHGAGGR